MFICQSSTVAKLFGSVWSSIRSNVRARLTYSLTNSTPALPTATEVLRVQITGSTGHTSNNQLSTPTIQSAAETAKAQKKSPVRSRMKPVTAEERAPAVLPKAHCSPVHRPEARGPAKVWLMGQTLAVVDPTDAPTSNNITTRKPAPRQ